MPIIVGGTGLYLSKLIDGINKIPAISDKIKKSSQELFPQGNKEAIKKELMKLGDDKDLIKDLDLYRLIRRFEVLKQTGKNMSYWHSQPKTKFYSLEQFIHFNIKPDRDLLYKKCNLRFKKMLDSGAILEVKNLMHRDTLKNSPPASKTIGFLEIGHYLRKEIDEEEMVKIATQKTRNYAKRQLTWFRNQIKDSHKICDDSTKSLTEILNLLDLN